MKPQPIFRSETQKAVNELATELNLPNRADMQDWAYEVANSDDIEKYIDCYKKTKDEDKKFVLMQMILQSLEDLFDSKNSKYCNIVKTFLESDFKIHEYTIYYWACLDENFDDCWKITPLMREIWNNKNI
jgi:hypothetical protein